MNNNCSYITRHKKVVCKEKGRQFCLFNSAKKRIEVGVVDGCLVTGNQERCDYYFDVESKIIFFVELKGSKIKKAVSQIISSVRHFTGKSNIPDKRGIIVCSKVPKMGTDFQRAIVTNQKELKKHSVTIEKPRCGVCKKHV